MITFTTDKGARRRDLDVLGLGRPPSSEDLAPMAYSGMVSGIQAVVQRVVISLLTERGSKPLDPGFGTDIPRVAGTGVRYTQSADAVITFAEDDVRQVLGRFQEGYEEDEDLESLSLSRQGEEGFNIEASITTRAGDTYTYVIPPPLQTTGA